MDPARFLDDLESKPAMLRLLGDALDADEAFRWPDIPPEGRLVLTGMGSSWFAAQVGAQRLRRHGVTAVAEIASAEHSWPTSDDLTLVAISASGSSTETLDFVGRMHDAPRIVALTNTIDSPLTAVATHLVDMVAGVEVSGIACRSELHTIIALLALEQHLTGAPLDLARGCRMAADGIETLLESRQRWLDQAAERLAGPHGTWLLAPAERISSALQGALMMREVPRRQADACETADWSHVDVYLTKTLEYRALVFPGSRYDAEAARWLTERGSTVVSVHAAGAPTFPGTALEITYPTGDHPLASLLVETTVAELVAAELVADRWAVPSPL